MKINKKFAKKTIVIASMITGITGLDSIFNEAQATNVGLCLGWGRACSSTIRPSQTQIWSLLQ